MPCSVCNHFSFDVVWRDGKAKCKCRRCGMLFDSLVEVSKYMYKESKEV